MDLSIVFPMFWGREKKEVVKEGFGKEALHVFNIREELQSWLDGLDYNNSVVLLMSSGNYDGMDVEAFAKSITQSGR